VVLDVRVSPESQERAREAANLAKDVELKAVAETETTSATHE
jgi:predicted signal transduction protein with EAL and GGDEF domain